MPQVQYFDRSGRALSRREAFEADGKTIRDGVRCRVPHHLADHAVRFTDGRQFWDQHRNSLVVVDPRRVGGVEGNRPGYRVFDSDVGRAEREAAYAEHESYLRDSWRTPPPDAAFGSLDRKMGDAKKKEDPPVTGRSRCPECDGMGVVHGKYCQGCGGDGWVDDDENNEDDDDNKESAASDRRMLDVQAMSAQHQRDMAALYRRIADDVSQQWRKP